MSQPLSAFYPLLLPELPACPEPMMDLHLREVARDFCLRTSAWSAPFDAIDLVASQASYDLDAPESDAVVTRVTKLSANSVLLWSDTDPATNEDAPKYRRDDPPFTVSNDLSEITLITEEVPTAAVTGGLQLVGALQPSRSSATLPDFLLTVYSDAMRIGTLARLMVMANKPWTDRALAGDYRTQWEQKVGYAAYQVDVGNTRKTLRVRKWG
ncbi:MAG: hypothetical protein WAW73_17470 [Rhodoferax sp.]